MERVFGVTVLPCPVVVEGERRGFKFNKRRVKRTQED